MCVFLYGGNDANNLLVPRDAGQYAAYAGPRAVLALPVDQLLPVGATSDGTGRGSAMKGTDVTAPLSRCPLRCVCAARFV